MWTLLTSAFSQREVMHLVSNLIALYFFGQSVAQFYGGGFLLALYLAGALTSALSHIGWSYYELKRAFLFCQGSPPVLTASLLVSITAPSLLCCLLLVSPSSFDAHMSSRQCCLAPWRWLHAGHLTPGRQCVLATELHLLRWSPSPRQ